MDAVTTVPAWVFQTLSTVFLAVTGYMLKGVADIQRDQQRRLNNHAQRLAMLDKSTDDD